MKTNKIMGILLLLIFVCVTTAILNDNFISPYNLQNLLRSSSMFAIIGIGAVMVIVTGGIDLSTGSLIGLVGCTMTMTLKSWMDFPPGENGGFLFRWIGLELIVLTMAWAGWDAVVLRSRPFKHRRLPKIGLFIAGASIWGLGFWIAQLTLGSWMTMGVAIIFSLLLAIHLGLLHGLLITKLQLQPFIVTLCGLMCYRGLTRWLTGDSTQGFGTDFDDSLRLLAIGKPCTATSVMLVVAIGAMCWGIWRCWAKTPLHNRRDAVITGAGLFGMGLILAVVCSSRYWDGWHVEYGQSLIQFASFDIHFFQLTIPVEAIQRPARLMSYAIYPMIMFLGTMIFVVILSPVPVGSSPSKKWKSIMGPLALMTLSVSSLYFLIQWIGDESVILQRLQQETLSGKLYEFVANDVTQKMAGVFLSMALLIGAILWISKTWFRDTGTLGRVLWTASGFFAALWLLGNTSINETIVQPPFFVMAFVGFFAAVFLNKTVSGRYLQALGNNEEAAEFSGINIDNMKITAYVLCALCGGIGSVLFTLNSNSVEPSGHGSFYELYAIAAAVLGGCSLRGGEGSILGVIIGASIMRVLYNAPDMIGIASQLEMFTIGIVILIGVTADETSKRIAARRNL